jgi:O-antigen/teichoic acid export membrane protein
LTAPTHDDPITADEVSRRAISGGFFLTAKGLALQAVAFAALLVVAQHLEPAELGVVAFGLTLTTLLSFLGGGQALGGALIRAPEAPSRLDLEALLALQLIVTLVLALATAAIAWPFGEVGRVTALMVCALPFTAFRVPGAVLLERELVYRRIVVVESSEALVYHIWTVATVLVGWGVWGLASATVARSAVGMCLMLALCPGAPRRPRLSWARSRRLLGLGARIQATELVYAARDQGLNLITAAVGGLSALGLWSLAYRVLQLPQLVFNSLLRVSFPATSRLVAHGLDLSTVIKRALAGLAVGTGLMLAPLAAASPNLVPALFGEKWAEAADILPLACFGFMIAEPAAMTIVGYLWAVGDGRTPLHAALASGAAWLSSSALLLPIIGAPALGVGLVAGALVSVAILRKGSARYTSESIISPTLIPILIWVVAAVAGWQATVSVGWGLGGAALGALLAETLFLLGVLVLRREALISILGVIHGALRGRPPFTLLTRRPVDAVA